MNIEEFVNDYLKEHRHDVLLNPHNGLVEFAEAFKEEMLKEAVEGEIFDDYDKDTCEHHLTILSTVPSGYKDGDKVRVIIIKKED